MDSLQKDQDEIIAMLSGYVQKHYSHNLMRRFFHPKSHGLLKATLTISPDIPPAWQIGIFQAGKSYKCWLQFSSTNQNVKPDAKRNFVGLALKVVEADFVQDFLCASFPTFQAKDVLMLKRFLRAITGNIWAKLSFISQYPLATVKAIFTRYPCHNLLEMPYWAHTTFKLGDTFQVRYGFLPQKPATSTKPETPTDNYLRERLQADLHQQEAFFDLMMQFRTNPATMPIEDSTVLWDSAWHKVATLHIPQQTFDVEARNKLGESMGFNPWYCLPEHEPLGDMHRIRKAVYEYLQAYRNQHNEIIYQKPTTQDWENTP